jgi:hypothetical protein
MVKGKEKITLVINHCWVEIIGAIISNTLFFLHKATILLWNFLSCMQGQFNEFQKYMHHFLAYAIQKFFTHTSRWRNQIILRVK